MRISNQCDERFIAAGNKQQITQIVKEMNYIANYDINAILNVQFTYTEV